MDLTVIQTGGTIDSVLENSKKGLQVSEEPAILKILKRGLVSVEPTIVKACAKNSTDLTEDDLNTISKLCKECRTSKILITHGTDVMVDTAKFLANQNIDKTIVLVGAFLPETFKQTDSDFNVGFALGALQCLSEKSVFIAMNGKLFHWSAVSHDIGLNYFI